MSYLLNSGKVGNLTSNKEILQKWAETGMLDGLNKIMQKKVGIAFENCAKFLLSDESPYKDVEWMFDVYIFPTIRRCMSEINEASGLLKRVNKNTVKEIKKRLLNNFDVKLVCEMLYENFLPLSDFITKFFEKYIKTDVEAETVAELSSMITYILCERERLQIRLEKESMLNV